MIKNKALAAPRGMGDEGITFSPSSRLLSAQLWYGGREKVVQTPEMELLLISSAAGRFPSRQHAEAVTPSEARRKCS